MIWKRLKIFISNFRVEAKITQETMEASNLAPNFLKKYKLADELPLNPFNINSFLQVGIEDPFPDDDLKYAGSLDDVDPDLFKLPDHPMHLVYDQCRYIQGLSPYCIYIPRREIMFKLMRACILVKQEEDLWLVPRQVNRNSDLEV